MNKLVSLLLALGFLFLLAWVGVKIPSRIPSRRRVSQGQRRIEEWLNSHGYPFRTEVPIRVGNPPRNLRFDIEVLPRPCSDLLTTSLRSDLLRSSLVCGSGASPRTFIEYDGAQHFTRIPFFDPTVEDFRDSQNRDRLKTQWAVKNGIPIIRIADWASESKRNESGMSEEEYIDYHLQRAFSTRPEIYLSSPTRYRYLQLTKNPPENLTFL